MSAQPAGQSGRIVVDPLRLGHTIAFLRGLAGLTQLQLGAKAGFKQAQIAAWETGQNVPGVPTLTRVMDALGYDIALIPREDS